MTDQDHHTITQLVAQYKRCDEQNRGIILARCRHAAMEHPSFEVKQRNQALFLELQEAERQLSMAHATERVVISPAEFNTALIAVIRPVALISAAGGVLYVLGIAVVAIAESVSVFCLAHGWIIVPAVGIAAIILIISSLRREDKPTPHCYEHPSQDIHINITRDGNITSK